jgi:hypothetical protein
VLLRYIVVCGRRSRGQRLRWGKRKSGDEKGKERDGDLLDVEVQRLDEGEAMHAALDDVVFPEICKCQSHSKLSVKP